MPDLLKRGSKGVGVKAMQTALLSLGYSLPRFGADGDFGAETEAAVKAFQTAHGLPATGAWDAVSQAKLAALLQPEDEDEDEPVDHSVLADELEGIAARLRVLAAAYRG